MKNNYIYIKVIYGQFHATYCEIYMKSKYRNFSVVFITDIIQRNPNNHITPMSKHFGDNSHLTGRNVQQIQAQRGAAI